MECGGEASVFGRDFVLLHIRLFSHVLYSTPSGPQGRGLPCASLSTQYRAISSTTAWPIRRIECLDQGWRPFDNLRYSTLQSDIRLHCHVPLYIICIQLNWSEVNWIFESHHHHPPSSWSIWPPSTASSWTYDLCSCPPFCCFLSCPYS